MCELILTITTRLHGHFNIPDALHRDSVLVIAIDKLVFQLANLVNENTELIRYIRDVIVARFTPYRQLLLW